MTIFRRKHIALCRYALYREYVVLVFNVVVGAVGTFSMHRSCLKSAN